MLRNHFRNELNTGTCFASLDEKFFFTDLDEQLFEQKFENCIVALQHLWHRLQKYIFGKNRVGNVTLISLCSTLFGSCDDADVDVEDVVVDVVVVVIVVVVVGPAKIKSVVAKIDL